MAKFTSTIYRGYDIELHGGNYVIIRGNNIIKSEEEAQDVIDKLRKKELSRGK